MEAGKGQPTGGALKPPPEPPSEPEPNTWQHATADLTDYSIRWVGELEFTTSASWSFQVKWQYICPDGSGVNEKRSRVTLKEKKHAQTTRYTFLNAAAKRPVTQTEASPTERQLRPRTTKPVAAVDRRGGLRLPQHTPPSHNTRSSAAKKRRTVYGRHRREAHQLAKRRGESLRLHNEKEPFYDAQVKKLRAAMKSVEARNELIAKEETEGKRQLSEHQQLKVTQRILALHGFYGVLSKATLPKTRLQAAEESLQGSALGISNQTLLKWDRDYRWMGEHITLDLKGRWERYWLVSEPEVKNLVLRWV